MVSSVNPDDRHSFASQPTPVFVLEQEPTVSLPVPLTSFIARDREMTTALDLLRNQHVRLLTLTGPGGAGKTRLALHVANALEEEFPDGVCFVPLSSIRDPGLTMPMIAQAHGNRETAGVSITEILFAYLRHRRELLVLDNFEQVVDAAPQLAGLLSACPNVVIIVTSQTALHIQGEQELAVLPMAIPPREAGATWRTPPLDELARYEAIELFVQRARSVQPDFELTENNALAVVEICRRLDGLPLAIELAAARIKLFSPSALLSRLATSLQVLTSGSRDLPERLQTMRSAIAWSYELLDVQEQRLMRWLAVFSSGFSLEAAEYVAYLQEPEIDLFDGVASLVDKSLLFPISSPAGESRFAMLETIREYGLEQLAEHGELEFIRQCHARWFQNLTSQANKQLMGPDAIAWMNQLEVEHDNLRAALDWAITSDNVETAMTMAFDIWLFWFQRGYFTEGGTWLERVLALRPSDPSPLLANTLTIAGLIVQAAGNTDLARERLEESLAIATELDDTRSIAMATFGLADLIDSLGHYKESNLLAQEAVTLMREVDEPAWLMASLSLLSLQAHWRGESELAEQFMDEGLELARQLGFGWGIAISLYYLGRIARDTGDDARALELLQESLVLWQQHRDPWRMLRLLIHIAEIAAESGQSVLAAQLLGASEAINEPLSAAIFVLDETAHDRAVERIRADLSPEEFDDAWNAGRHMSRDEAVDVALEVSVAADGDSLPPTPATGAGHNLTPREIEVLQLLVAGRSDREIAEALFISPRTAQSHVGSIFTKLNVNSRTAAATAALRLGLVDDDLASTS